MLFDDVDQIRTIDKKNMMARVLGLPQQIRDTLDAMADVSAPKEYSECKYIVAVGMGGSGIPGDFVRAIYRAECPVPIFVHKGYGLPPFVGSDALVLAVSYTGTTEETISAFSEALKRKAKIFGISGGDKLLALLKENGLPYFVPPAGHATRGCFGYLLLSMIKVLEMLNYVPDQSSNITATLSLLDKLSSAYAPEIPTSDNEAKRIATKLHNKTPLLYGSIDLTDVVALRWKQQINENSKMLVQVETFPDLTHNQLAAIVNLSGMEKELCPVILRNENEGAELSRRIDATREMLARKGFDLIEPWAEGTTRLASLLSQSYLGDFTSLYLAILNGVDPTPTTAMSELKHILGLTDLSPR
jgi:glucose/mannose-6-phosphate isomerase